MPPLTCVSIRSPYSPVALSQFETQVAFAKRVNAAEAVVAGTRGVSVGGGRPGNGDWNCGAHTGPGSTFTHCTSGIFRVWPGRMLKGSVNPLACAMAPGRTP